MGGMYSGDNAQSVHRELTNNGMQGGTSKLPDSPVNYVRVNRQTNKQTNNLGPGSEPRY